MLVDDILSALPAREGHFVMESGYHTNHWFSLDALFVHPRALAPLITALAGRLRPYGVSAVCGPLLGGAFVAQALATDLGVDFYFAEPAAARSSSADAVSSGRRDAALRLSLPCMR